MSRRAVGAAVVMDPDGTGPGIITERDILSSLGAGEDPDAELVAEHLTSDVVYAAPDWSLEEAAAAMVRGGFRHLIVVERERLWAFSPFATSCAAGPRTERSVPFRPALQWGDEGSRAVWGPRAAPLSIPSVVRRAHAPSAGRMCGPVPDRACTVRPTGTCTGRLRAACGPESSIESLVERKLVDFAARVFDPAHDAPERQHARRSRSARGTS